MVVWKLYSSTTSDKKEFKPKGEITDDTYVLVLYTCPLTGGLFKTRNIFWFEHILCMDLDPKNIDYGKCINYNGEVNTENINKLMGLDMFSYIWTNYFKGKMRKKQLEDIIGYINIEFLINLVKIVKF